MRQGHGLRFGGKGRSTEQQRGDRTTVEQTTHFPISLNHYAKEALFYADRRARSIRFCDPLSESEDVSHFRNKRDTLASCTTDLFNARAEARNAKSMPVPRGIVLATDAMFA